MFFPIHGLQIWKGGIKSLKNEENSKHLKKGLAQDAQGALSVKTSSGAKQGIGALSANTDTRAKRTKCVKHNYEGPSPLQQL